MEVCGDLYANLRTFCGDKFACLHCPRILRVMRGENFYIWQLARWPEFRFDSARLAPMLARVHEARGRLLARLDLLGLAQRDEATLACLTEDALRTSEIEGEQLAEDSVRSSFARRLGIEIAKPKAASRSVEGLVEVLLDALWKSKSPLDEQRLCSWHAALFPTGFSGLSRIEVGKWRTKATGPMRVLSGPHGRQKVHFEAPPPKRVKREMALFLAWLEQEVAADPIVHSGLAHLWFVTIHPFSDGNGRIARAIGDLVIARTDGQAGRFYSVSSQIAAERQNYYDTLERTQRGTLDISDWLAWYIACVERAIERGLASAAEVSLRSAFWTRHAGVAFNTRQVRVLRRFLLGFEGNLTAAKWAKLSKCSGDTALRDLNDLIEKGVLRRSDRGGRSTSYEISD
jgi:Fic family protein